MNEPIALIVQAVLAFTLAWSCFCRMVKTSASTRREIRWAIWFLCITAGMVLVAPVLPLVDPAHFGWPPLTTPAPVWLALLLAIVFIQLATARHWRGGVPGNFEKG